MRFRVESRDVPPVVAARRLGLTEAQFESCRLDLEARGFPLPDPTTGNYDLKAVDAWQDRRSGLGSATVPEARDARTFVRARIEEMRRGAG